MFRLSPSDGPPWDKFHDFMSIKSWLIFISVGTSRLPKTQHRFTVLDNLFQALEPDPPCYGKPTVSAAANQLAKNVRLLRTVRGWSQETLALNAGLDRSFVGAIERAERNLTLATAEKIANAFQLTVTDLISAHTTEALLSALTGNNKKRN